MCGTPISGPILILFFPLALGVRAYDFIMNTIHTMDQKIRKNNEKIENGVNHHVSNLKDKIFFRKQLMAESKLESKIQSTTDKQQENNSPLAHLYVQRAVVRLAAMKYDGALADVKLALDLDPSLEQTYVWNFVCGVALYHCGEHVESAHAFRRGIELKQAISEEGGNCDLKSVELEKSILDVNMEMKHTHEKVKEHLTEFSESTKSYFNQLKSAWLKGEKQTVTTQSSDSAATTAAVPLISLEELHFRAGCAYYFGACYQDAIKHFESAIELGSSSPNLKHYIYNKGLCYYYSHDLDQALETFNSAFKLDLNDETAKMISQTYGRMGNLTKKQEYIKKALELNSKTKLTTEFNYRLLDEDCTNLVFSYLPTYSRVMLSSTNKYWRELLMRSVCNCDEVFEISLRNLVNNMHQQNRKIENRSIREKIFLPGKEKKTANDFICEVLQSSFFKYFLEKKEKKRVIITSIYESYFRSFYINEKIHPFLKDLEYLSVYSHTWVNSYADLQVLSPNLTELVLRDDGGEDGNLDYYNLPKSFVNFTKLRTLTLLSKIPEYFMQEYKAYGEFEFPESLETIYYHPDSCSEFNTVIATFPRIVFIPLDEKSKKFTLTEDAETGCVIVRDETDGEVISGIDL